MASSTVKKVFTGGNIKHKQTCRTDELNMH